ncbi:MAG TPA: carboxypeptidase-like regulatory domain-containing protein [Polyangiaceae bacterium]
MPRPVHSCALSCFILLGCGGDDDEPEPRAEACSIEAQSGCDAGLVCEAVVGAADEVGCFAPVTVRGRVVDALSGDAIANAHVVARDANGAAVSSVAVTETDGSYALTVPVTRTDANGALAPTFYTLRADAARYATFPRAPRVALPIEVSTAVGDPPVVQNTATDVALIPLPDGAAAGSISGRVLADHPGGTLVVAGGATAVADRNGQYTVFNVPTGNVTVQGYAAALNLGAVAAEVRAGEETAGVVLRALGEANVAVSGSIQIVNAAGGMGTSVILVVEDTFEPNAASGESPPGLRAANVSGAWSIPAVPNGKYVVLGAFENDDLVRDPDTSIGGTDVQRIEVAGAAVTVPGFKITGALAVLSPGAETTDSVSGTPEFTWEDDSSEDSYEVLVFDALGNSVWATTGNFDPGGGRPASVTYAGPALSSGMIYQFRATSLKDGVPISRTEDLKGVFVYR